MDKYGLKKYHLHIPIHHLADISGPDKSRALLKNHILTGWDFVSKVESKLSAFNTQP